MGDLRGEGGGLRDGGLRGKGLRGVESMKRGV